MELKPRLWTTPGRMRAIFHFDDLEYELTRLLDARSQVNMQVILDKTIPRISFPFSKMEINLPSKKNIANGFPLLIS